MRSQTDALRSLKRYVSQMLPPEWEVSLTPRTEGHGLRPLAVVKATAPATFPRSHYHTASVVRPFAVYAYPVAGTTDDAALLAATEAEELLFRGFRVGVEDGHQMRVPLWDWDGVPLDQTSVDRLDCDYMNIDDLTTQHLAEPENNRLWVAVAELRMSWRRVAERENIDIHLVRDVDITGEIG